jgi:hypothetical protein
MMSWWWSLPLAVAAVCAAFSLLVTRRLRAETADVLAVTRAVAVANDQVRATGAQGGPGLDSR